MEVACDVEEHGILQVEVAMITELQQSFLAFCSWMGLLKQTGYGYGFDEFHCWYFHGDVSMMVKVAVVNFFL